MAAGFFFGATINSSSLLLLLLLLEDRLRFAGVGCFRDFTAVFFCADFFKTGSSSLAR